MPDSMEWAGGLPPALFSATLSDAVPHDIAVANIRSAMARDIPRFHPRPKRAGKAVLAGGGPSLATTWPDIDRSDHIIALNGAHDFLIERGIVPDWCVLLDPTAELAEDFRPHRGVDYYVASQCDPKVLDRLDGQATVLWHASTPSRKEDAALKGSRFDEGGYVCGGSTVGLRAILLAYLAGWRDFDLHGFDSSVGFEHSHAYAHRHERIATMMVRGYPTAPCYFVQVPEFFELLSVFATMEPTTFEVFGDGVLQAFWREWREVNPEGFRRR